MRMLVSPKSPHQGFFLGSPKARPSRFSQSISQLRSRASMRRSVVFAFVIHGKAPGCANDAERPFAASSCFGL